MTPCGRKTTRDTTVCVKYCGRFEICCLRCYGYNHHKSTVLRVCKTDSQNEAVNELIAKTFEAMKLTIAALTEH